MSEFSVLQDHHRPPLPSSTTHAEASAAWELIYPVHGREQIRNPVRRRFKRGPERVRGLTADFQVHVLVVLADGVAGGAQVLARVRELDVFQGEGGHPRVAAHHNVPVQALRRREEGYSQEVRMNEPQQPG